MEFLGFGPAGYGDELAWGMAITLVFSLTCYFFALVIGVVLGLMASSRYTVLRVYWRVHSSIIMGVPPLLIIFFVYFNLPLITSSVLGQPVDISPFLAGVVALSLNIGTYVGEVVRGAIFNIPRGQTDAVLALALPFRIRWQKVFIPQIFRLALPGLSNLWLVLVKETALVSLVGLQDIVRVAKIAAGNTFQPFLFYIVVGVLFVVMGYLTMLISRHLDRRFNFWSASR